ncbi:hypothetical protein BUALT_Bualt04G0050900 [Buddleja alternifolia]|uniref:Receptor-like serine/threonine-protein kinase n=1 Tax=Buddleja alternifolia TaxID=168488 RepID=A0AAV6XLF9_9LAMI|nr:hypothetical protein BUALT_Bualt04G0050900 [Buddleja alternifolia]
MSKKMGAFLLSLLFLCALSTSAIGQQVRSSNISLGSTLTPNTNLSWFSPSRIFAFGFFPQNNNGYCVGVFCASFSLRTVAWTANRDNNPVVSEDVNLVLTNDGRLILRHGQGQNRDIYVANPSEPIAWGSMLDNGNFVLYNSDSRIIWQSFDHPTNTLLPGQRLSPGQELFSSASKTDRSRGIFRLKMQTDGNLVQYPVNTPDTIPYAYYSSATYSTGNNVSLNLENDGYLFLYNGSSVLRNITSGGYPVARTIYLMRLDVDGIFRLYSRSLDRDGHWTTRWSSTDDGCTPKGLCGINGFCIQMDQTADCKCLPGFDFVHSGNWRAGCSRNFTVEGCGEKDLSVDYEMKRVDNVVWEDNSFAMFDTVTVEKCRQACLDDCNCDAAFFKDRQCSKQRLPLRYGRRLVSDSNIALVKVSTPVPVTAGRSDPVIGNNGHLGPILGSTASIFCTALVFGIIAFVHWRKKRSEEIEEDYLDHVPGMPTRFSYEELVIATNNFDKKLGEGGFGSVFEGHAKDGTKIAVKCLDGIGHIKKSFLAEVESTGSIHHVNLVRLIGFCAEKSHRLLVYEYMPNGSLDKWIYSRSQEMSLNWRSRRKIVLDIARGLAYLHEDCRQKIIHLDIKPQNILLDENYNAKIADFGLSKLIDRNQSQVVTTMKGTPGYLAPEWLSAVITEKVDVYSFGIVVLEIVCGRKNFDQSKPEDERHLLSLFKEKSVEGQCLDLIDKCCEDMQSNATEVMEMMKIAAWCLQNDYANRPSMFMVIKVLGGVKDAQIDIDYNMMNFRSLIAKIPQVGSQDVTPLLHSVLSGPR